MKRNLWFATLITSFLLTSCSTDFEVNAPYKELTTVFGLLDQTKPEQFIRINKSFLGEGDALSFAKFQDSLNYKKGELDVKLERYKDGVLQPAFTETLERIGVKKQEGVFADSTFVYKAINPLFEDSEYKLVIYNKKNDQVATATTPLIKDVTIIRPIANTPTLNTRISFRNQAGTQYSNFPVEWNPGKNARIFELVLRFHYIEKDTVTNVETAKYIDWNVTRVALSGTSSSQRYDINGEEFFRFVGNNILESSTVNRYATKTTVDLIVNAGGEELDTYIQVASPSTGIIQEKPEYTNINNGIGIFSTRFTTAVQDKQLEVKSLDELRSGQYTKNLFK